MTLAWVSIQDLLSHAPPKKKQKNKKPNLQEVQRARTILGRFKSVIVKGLREKQGMEIFSSNAFIVDVFEEFK